MKIQIALCTFTVLTIASVNHSFAVTESSPLLKKTVGQKAAAPSPIDKKIYEALGSVEEQACTDKDTGVPCVFKVVGSMICTKSGAEYSCTLYRMGNSNYCAEDIYNGLSNSNIVKTSTSTPSWAPTGGDGDLARVTRHVTELQETFSVTKAGDKSVYYVKYSNDGGKTVTRYPSETDQNRYSTCDKEALCSDLANSAKYGLGEGNLVSRWGIIHSSYCKKFFIDGDNASISNQKSKNQKSEGSPGRKGGATKEGASAKDGNT